MRKKGLRIFIFVCCLAVLMGGIGVVCHYLTANSERKEEKHMAILANAKSLYVPTSDDCSLYFDPKTTINKPYRDAIYQNFKEHFEQIEAIYEIRNIPESRITEMLNNSSGNLQVWGYVLWLRNVHDINFDYIVESFKSNDRILIEAKDQLLYGECCKKNILLLIALGGLDAPKLLQESHYRAHSSFGLTAEQKNALKTEYDKCPEKNPDLDSWIRCLFEEDNESAQFFIDHGADGKATDYFGSKE